MHSDLSEVLFSEEDLARKLDYIAAKINKDYKGRNPLIIGILKGAFMFMSDLLKKLDIDCEIDFMVASSYGKRVTSSGIVAIKKDLETPVVGRDIIIVEDIIDTGNTLSAIKKMLLKAGANDVQMCTLFNKEIRRKIKIDIKYYGFIIGDAFIVGYGLDYDEKYRNLPYIGVLKPEVYAKNIENDD